MTTTRRFAAILAANVVGYSRMGDHSIRLTSTRDVPSNVANAQIAIIPERMSNGQVDRHRFCGRH
jgi:hypothetical protein